MDLRQNQRGRFVKVTMLAGGKTFIAIPGVCVCVCVICGVRVVVTVILSELTWLSQRAHFSFVASAALTVMFYEVLNTCQ